MSEGGGSKFDKGAFLKAGLVSFLALVAGKMVVEFIGGRQDYDRVSNGSKLQLLTSENDQQIFVIQYNDSRITPLIIQSTRTKILPDGTITYNPEPFSLGGDKGRRPGEVLGPRFYRLATSPELEAPLKVGLYRTPSLPGGVDWLEDLGRDEIVYGIPVITWSSPSAWVTDDKEGPKTGEEASGLKITQGWAVGRLTGNEFRIRGYVHRSEPLVEAST